MAKKPFKLQSLQKLNNRIIEKDLRNLANCLVHSIMKSENTLKDIAAKPNDAAIAPEAIVAAITEGTVALIEALKLVSPMGLRQWEVLNAQQTLTHKSSQEELEAFFKLITKPTKETVEEAITDAQKRATTKGNKQCECMSCKLKRAAKKALGNPTENTKIKPQVKLVEVTVPEGGSIEDAVNAAMEAIIADRDKGNK